MTRQIISTGLNHRTAPVELRERFALSAEDLPQALQVLNGMDGVSESVILSTCNRVELYTLEDTEHGHGRGSASFFRDFFDADESVYINHLYRYYDEQATRHLFTVAASLDSMIIGEPQILGQVKDHFVQAQISGTTGRIFNSLFSRALSVGKRVRAETDIGKMAVSVPYAAVELAKRVFGSLRGKSVCLVGRGKMSEVTARSLRGAGVEKLYAVHRDETVAADFAALIGGTPQAFDDSLDFITAADIVMCSTNALHPIITQQNLLPVLHRRRNRVLLIIDISVPRVVDPAVNELENVYLFNVDNLQDIVAENTRLRMEEARSATAIIEEELLVFHQWLDELDVVPTIRAFREHLESVRREAVDRILRNYEGFTPEQRELVEQFSRLMINKISHEPTLKLKTAPNPEKAINYSETLRQLFELRVHDEK